MGRCVLNWKTDLIKNPNISVPLTTLEACMKELPLPNSFGKLLWNCMAADAYFHEIPTSVDEIKESLSDLSEFFKHSFDVAGVKQRDVDQETLQKLQQLQKVPDWIPTTQSNLRDAFDQKKRDLALDTKDKETYRQLTTNSKLYDFRRHTVLTPPEMHGFSVNKLHFGTTFKRTVYRLLAGNAMSPPVVGSVMCALMVTGLRHQFRVAVTELPMPLPRNFEETASDASDSD
ncbi:hypothetical protein AK812_SmicGene26712 [Symbiodinium microadriaticum]|uniref:Uncharacterized protein n=1 Tax=Symbiodinium microadriaticum TaxID=2951 RepID=A0A1Q9D8V5_SYMMI|nr:hypothetical protein AK812_SmicGene26712 [Symbiodinium microadriaticum]